MRALDESVIRIKPSALDLEALDKDSFLIMLAPRDLALVHLRQYQVELPHCHPALLRVHLQHIQQEPHGVEDPVQLNDREGVRLPRHQLEEVALLLNKGLEEGDEGGVIGQGGAEGPL